MIESAPAIANANVHWEGISLEAELGDIKDQEPIIAGWCFEVPHRVGAVECHDRLLLEKAEVNARDKNFIAGVRHCGRDVRDDEFSLAARHKLAQRSQARVERLHFIDEAVHEVSSNQVAWLDIIRY